MNFETTKEGITCYDDGFLSLFRIKVSNWRIGTIKFSNRDGEYLFYPNSALGSVDLKTLQEITKKMKELKNKK